MKIQGIASMVAQQCDNLTRGRLGLRAIEDEEAIAAGLDPAVTADPGYVRAGGPVDGIELFDAAVFGFTEREAEIMEPQHRLLLECAWEALENAGYRPTEPGSWLSRRPGSGDFESEEIVERPRVTGAAQRTQPPPPPRRRRPDGGYRGHAIWREPPLDDQLPG